MLHFFGSEHHFRAHWDGVRNALQSRWVSPEEVALLENREVPIFVASYGDLKRVYPYRNRIVLAEHGTGLTYNENHSSYAGSTAFRDKVILRLVPNKFAAAKEEKYNPGTPLEIIGVPRLDPYYAKRRSVQRNALNPLVVISTHWDCMVAPETRSSFQYYKDAIAHAALGMRIALHAHPRIATRVSTFARANRIEFIRDFDVVMQKADLYAVDNSSTLFEFAATGKPVLVLNGPEYRKDVEHEFNPRFWSRSDIGENVWNPYDLEYGIKMALRDAPEQRERREEIVKEVLPYLGRSTRRTIDMLNAYTA
jgi:hypothetical protein